MMSRLAGWKTQFLNLAGRTTLAQSTLSTIQKMDQHIESTLPVPNPTVHSSNSDPDPLPSDHDQTVADEISRCINDVLQKQLVLEEAWLDEEPSGYANGEEQEKEEEFMNRESDVDGEEAVVVVVEEEEEAQNGSNEAHYDNWGEDGKVGDEFEGGLKSVKSNGSSSSNGSKSYPVRPEVENCFFYMKTDHCKFGSNCKFNHPVKRKGIKAAKDNVKDKEEGTKKAGQTECKYYLRTGGCKYGGACRFNHSKSKSQALPTKTQVLPAKTITLPVSEFNFLGLPIRPGERECPYYMRNGSCKYESNCRFNHPDPTAVAGNDPPSAFGNGRSATAQSSSQASGASWSSPRALNGSSLFMPAMFPLPQTQNVPPRSPEWKGYQAPLYPPDISAHQPPAYNIGNPRTGSNVYMQQQQQQQQQITGDEFPERPGQPECINFLKTGVCKFRSNCKYHHPKNRNSKSSPCLFSDKGLPLRPDQMICSRYSRYGICKFGRACKFDHPEHHVPSTGPGEYQSIPFGNYENEKRK